MFSIQNAKTFKLVCIDVLNHDEANWKDIIPQHDKVREGRQTVFKKVIAIGRAWPRIIFVSKEIVRPKLFLSSLLSLSNSPKTAASNQLCWNMKGRFFFVRWYTIKIPEPSIKKKKFMVYIFLKESLDIRRGISNCLKISQYNFAVSAPLLVNIILHLGCARVGS